MHRDRYINDIGELQRQVLRHNRTSVANSNLYVVYFHPISGDDETVTSSVNSMKIAFDNEYPCRCVCLCLTGTILDS